MELFGITPDGKIALSSGAEPTPRQVDQIMKACAAMVSHFAYQNAIKKGLQVLTPAGPEKEIARPIEQRKADFLKSIRTYAREHHRKYPFGLYNEFYDYWIEASKGGKMRFEDQKFWSLGKRLKTFWSNIENKSKYWAAHDIKFPPTQTGIPYGPNIEQ